MAADDYAGKQSQHAANQKAIRAIVDDTGVSRSQARAALHQASAQASFNRFAAINQANQLPPKPAPKFEAQGAKLEVQPLLPPVAVNGAGQAAQNAPMGTPVSITYCDRNATPIANATINVLTVP